MTKITSNDNFALFEYLQANNCQELHFFSDPKLELQAIIAIHNTNLGPSLGGCRCIEYDSVNNAIVDAVRLAKGMSQKAAVANLSLGGGKAVLIKPKSGIKNRKEYFKAFGRFVDSLGGRYITAVDSGTSVEDMDWIEQVTKHVTSTNSGRFNLHDPSPMTAYGVLSGIKASAKFKYGTDDLSNKHVLVQGLGHVGMPLCELLYNSGAKLTVFDINAESVKSCVNKYKASYVNTFEELLKIKANIFAPCALGAVINDYTIEKLNVDIIAGGSNNQLAEPKHGAILHNKNILYAPDYAINAGGLIHVAEQHFGATEEQSKIRVGNIYNTLLEIFERSKVENKPPEIIADIISNERIYNEKITNS